MERGKKRVVDSQLESVHLVRMNHLNSAGRLFGGQLMQWIDETYAETVTGEQFLINCAYATEVAVGEDGKPTIVPELIIETEEEQYEWDRSVLRRELRKKHG